MPVQVADLAVVLYRDFGLLDNVVSIHDLIDIFTYEFGYASETGAPPNANFNTLYSLESTKNWEQDWLEMI
ncbi:MAG: hypothetical protein CYG59_07385 [Chloroflexi bacterium]|nr:MAG: hypothetical protein CYG59_07385 [Chloroflexota bacterium]